MPTLIAPRDVGSSINAFTQAFLAGSKELRDQQAAEQLRRLTELRINEGTAAETARMTLPQDIEALMAATGRLTAPQPSLAASAPPATAMLESNLPPEMAMAEGVGPPGSVPPTPGRSFITQPELMKELGPQGPTVMARMTQRPQWGELSKQIGMVTPEEADRRLRVEAARKKSRELHNQVVEDIHADKPEEALMKMGAAMREMAEAAQDPSQRATMLKNAEQYYQDAAKLMREPKQLALYKEEAKRQADALFAYEKAPSLENLVALDQAHFNVTSDLGKKDLAQYAAKRDTFVRKLAEDARVKEVFGKLTEIMNMRGQREGAVEYEGALAELFRTDPRSYWTLMEWATTNVKKLPRKIAEVMGIADVKDSDWTIVRDFVDTGVRTGAIKPEDKARIAFEKLKELKTAAAQVRVEAKEKSDAEKDADKKRKEGVDRSERERTKLQSRRKELETDLEQLEKRLADTFIPKQQAPIQERIGHAKKEIGVIDKRIKALGEPAVETPAPPPPQGELPSAEQRAKVTARSRAIKAELERGGKRLTAEQMKAEIMARLKSEGLIP